MMIIEDRLKSTDYQITQQHSQPLESNVKLDVVWWKSSLTVPHRHLSGQIINLQRSGFEKQ